MRRLLVVLGVLLLLVVLVVAALVVLQPKPTPATVTRPTVAMPDGVQLAVDVILPKPALPTPLPTVLIQTRYWRSFGLKFPDRPDAVPPMPREPIVDRLVETGYAVVVADVRGTGASEGHWPHPFGEQEVNDAGALVAWIAAQPWSNGRVGTTGVSYEGSTALLTAANRSPALKAVLAREIEWDLVDEIIAPGGVRNLSFVDAWSRSVAALDHNEVPELFPSYVKYISTGVHPVDADAGGARLSAIVSQRTVPAVATAVANVRGPGDPFGEGGPPAGSIGPSAHVEAMKGSPAALAVWGGWWDGATGDAVLRADAALGLTEAVIGPWLHEGTASASPFPGGTEVTVELAQVVRFFDKHLKGDAPSLSGSGLKRWWIAGAERWASGTTWPVTTPRRWSLAPAGTLSPESAELDVALAVVHSTTQGPSTRWTAGMLKPVAYTDRHGTPGLVSWSTAPLAAPLSFFGEATLTCSFTPDGPDAALHATLELVGADGKARYLTEGVRRLKAGHDTVTFRALAAEVPKGASLRVTIAGADADTFERVPATGPRVIRLQGTVAEPCEFALPAMP